MVLCLALYLVEAGYFKKVNFIFYIVGHTKNAADRWFNQLKKTYRKSNIYTREQLELTLKTNKAIGIRKVVQGDFKDYESFWNKFYKKL